MNRFLIVIGVLFSYSASDILAQQTQFFRTYSMGLYDVAEQVIPINDTNYIAIGTTQTGGVNGADMLIFNTNSTGELNWWKNIGGTGIENAKGVVRTLDSTGYLITGFRNNLDSMGYDVLLVKTDFSGNLIWSQVYGGNNWEISSSIGCFADSTYLVAGETYSYGAGQKDVYLIKVDGNGDTLWTRTFGGTGDDYAKSILMDRNNNALIIGGTQSFGSGNYDAYLIYIDINGDTIWTKTIGTGDDDFGYSAAMNITVSNTMEFIVGYTSYYAPDQAQNSYILKIDSLGNAITTYPQMEANAEILDHIKLISLGPDQAAFTADIKYGYNEIGIIYMLRMSTGFSPWIQNTYGGSGNEGSYPTQIIRALDGGFLISGYCENWGPGPTSAFLLKTDSMTYGPNVPVVGLNPVTEDLLSIFPNPVEGDYFYINASSALESIRLFNLNGQVIKVYPLTPNQQSVILEKPNVVPGIYVVDITTKQGNYRRKIRF